MSGFSFQITSIIFVFLFIFFLVFMIRDLKGKKAKKDKPARAKDVPTGIVYAVLACVSLLSCVFGGKIADLDYRAPHYTAIAIAALGVAAAVFVAVKRKKAAPYFTRGLFLTLALALTPVMIKFLGYL
ncbi:MAG: hypothetical protein IJM45_09605 [Clostridia bacterium]|nr:hypothetical protein [Clostridia bacterium]